MLNVIVIKKDANKPHQQFAVPLNVIKYATELYDKDKQDQETFLEDIQEAEELTELVNEIAESGWLSNPTGSIDYLQQLERHRYAFCVTENNIFYFGHATFEQLKQIHETQNN